MTIHELRDIAHVITLTAAVIFAQPTVRPQAAAEAA